MADEHDLPHIGGIFDAASTWLIENYRPDQVGQGGFPLRERFNRHLLDTGVIFLAEDPEPAGFAAAIVRDGVWFLSQLWVVPEKHGSGIGSALLEEALAWGRGARTFSVVASPYPVAQLIYLRASMFPLWTQVDLAGPRGTAEAPEGVEPVGPNDQTWIDELDRAAHGSARPEDHAFWKEMARGFALRRDGRGIGYVYVWPEGKIGPGVAAEPADMPLVLAAGRAFAESDRSMVSVPSSNWSALRELTGLGFRPIGSNTYMSSRPIGDASRYLSSGGGLG